MTVGVSLLPCSELSNSQGQDGALFRSSFRSLLFALSHVLFMDPRTSIPRHGFQGTCAALSSFLLVSWFVNNPGREALANGPSSLPAYLAWTFVLRCGGGLPVASAFDVKKYDCKIRASLLPSCHVDATRKARTSRVAQRALQICPRPVARYQSRLPSFGNEVNSTKPPPFLHYFLFCIHECLLHPQSRASIAAP